MTTAKNLQFELCENADYMSEFGSVSYVTVLLQGDGE